ncbi:DNA (cytosine-5-)-methyltransferase [Candidatus Pacearchaeota archaeon CG1_02_31_27]|nr:MAG: DNA (cytosine-5-)-methyltransferase [Candidatus Pacearchaeota archaeon CG1_02_31_27]
MKIASFFSGAGGLDLGFSNAGFSLAFANDNWKGCWETFEKNHNHSICKKSITEIKPEEIPEVVGFVGGPPCQSWSLAGAMRGINDSRGKLFYNYVELIKAKQPLFFLAENVAGILSDKHLPEFEKIIQAFKEIGYNVSYKLLNAKDYGVPQDRKRVIIVGYHNKVGKKFEFPQPTNSQIFLKDAIGDLPPAKSAKEKNKTNGKTEILNHEYMNGGFSTIYMSRNRVREWNEHSFTIQAGGRHAPIHPQAPKMKFIEQNKREFVKGKEHLYRRLSVRECARIQTFPDNFEFHYVDVADGYKMIGNAVPVKLAEVIANKIMEDIKESNN